MYLFDFLGVFYVAWYVLLFQCVRCDSSDETIRKCINQKVKTELQLPMEIINDEGELEIWIYYNGKYDLYQTYNNGHIYHEDLRLSEQLSPRTGANRANCTNYLRPIASWYGCPFTVTENDFKVNITVESFQQKNIYSIDKTTKNVAFIRIENEESQEKNQLNCVHKVAKYQPLLPVDVSRVENHLEITVKYQGKYDFYNTISLGTVCGIQYQVDEKPITTVEDYAHCSKCGNSAELYAWCPFNIVESETNVTFTLEAFFYKNVYTVNKSTKEVHYEKSLIGEVDPHKDFERQINQCKDNLSAVNFTLPVQIIRNSNFLEIWIKRNDKYDVFETFDSGSICKHYLQSSHDPNVLVHRAPANCFSPGFDVPYYFICPYEVLQDEEFVYFNVHSLDQYLYAFNKATGAVTFRQFPTLFDSNHQSTVAYLRSVVLDPNHLYL
ncbi:hypothetical protein Bhyg_05033 [Pseudolycoriella hygida]|uniref:Uncharacterized protein n=1 Tax=Pseudolycoriella hygida TaxID=35572 RepID=A0A9Q0SA09_9DIPT|nr:hypothetical protein Bhyg_05033 [Pseudolycoriella hygida]